MQIATSGMVAFRAVPTPRSPYPARILTLREISQWGFPRPDLPHEVLQWRRRNIRHLWRGLSRVMMARLFDIPHFYGQLYLSPIDPTGKRIDLGLASMRVVTDVGVEFIVKCFRGLATASNMRYHGFGTNGTIEAVTNTALLAEIASEYNPANTRPTGTLELGSATDDGPLLSNIFRTKATLTTTTSVTLVEHGLFSQAPTTGGTPVGGVLLDRSVYTPYELIEGFSLEATYDFTLSAGG
jgi:hypothetical protein